MNLLNRLTYKNLKLNKKRTIVTIIGIMLSVALITAVTAMFFSAKASLIKFEISKKGNYHYSFINVPESDIKYFKDNRNFENIYFINGLGYANLPESKNDYKPYIYVRGFDKKAIKEAGVKLVEGRLPENDEEILIPTHLKTNGRVVYKVGDTLKLEVGRRVSVDDGLELNQDNPYDPEFPEKIIDCETKEYKIVGIIERLSSSIENYSAPGYTFVTKIDDENISGKNLNIYVRYKKEVLDESLNITADILGVNREAFNYLYSIHEDYDFNKAQEYQEQIKDMKYGFDTNSYLIQLESNIFGDSASKTLGVVVLIVVSIIIFTSVFCIKNSFNISITEKTKQYGMLSTVGATSKQIKKNVYYEALMLGLIGIPLGILCGLLASYILIIISNLLIEDWVGFKLIYRFSWLSILFAIVLGLITLYLSAWSSAHKASKITPIAAINNSGDIKIKSKHLKTPNYIKRIFKIGGEISYKNLCRNKKKYRATVISIIVCVSIFIALSSFVNLAFRSVQNEFSTTDYNIELSYHYNENTKFQDKAYGVLNLDNIKDYSIVSNSEIYLENNLVRFSKEYLKYIPDAQKTYTYEDENGNMVEDIGDTYIGVFKVGDHAYQKYLKELGLDYEKVKNKGVLINDAEIWAPVKEGSNNYVRKIVPLFEYEKGETLSWNRRTRELDADGNNKTEKVNIELALVTDKNPFGLKSITYGDGAKIIISDEYFKKLFPDQLSRNDEKILIYSNNASKLQDEIEKLLGDDDSYSLTNTEENVKMMQSFYTLVAIFLYGFITVIALIGVTNIFNTITTNMELRSREFATLKSVGMTKKEFNRMISLESFFYGTKSLLIGIPIGCALSYLIFHFLSADDSLMKYELPLFAILLSTLAVFILISIIMKYSINKISKQNTIETIRNENI